jgi:polyisoprenoid-binding protein YceI
MCRKLPGFILCTLVYAVALASPLQAADDYIVDGSHAAVNFKVSHLGLSWTYGRFNDLSGTFSIDPDPGKCNFALTIKTESLDTANQKRDEHLRSPDFFNAKQFPTIVFKTSTVKAIKDGYEVTGDFTMHGVTKSITFPLVGGRKAEFPAGVHRTGFTAEMTLKRSAYGITKFAEAVGDDVHITVSFEGTKK